LALVGVAGAGVLGVLALSGLDDQLVYYRTPSEVTASAGQGERLRLGGQVESGSLHREGSQLRFTLTDGAHDVPVVYVGDTTAVFQEGQGAVVEGTLDGRGTFHAESLMVKHSNSYVDGRGGSYRPPG
jgi:cytochrome c-type biogenesis protein CcmE